MSTVSSGTDGFGWATGPQYEFDTAEEALRAHIYGRYPNPWLRNELYRHRDWQRAVRKALGWLGVPMDVRAELTYFLLTGDSPE